MAILSILILTVTVLFLLRGHILPMIPPMPYTSVVSLSFVLFAIAVLVAIGCIYFGAFIRQWGKAYLRFKQNIMAQANGNAPLPALSIYPQIHLKVNRRLRNIALFALLILVASLTVTIVISQVQSGSLGFWHTWHWFEK
ncbi:MAG: hypothetical protein VB108_08450 [Anaerolineaceae bacterium]|nr:hypothetical protein [Anaerolineaceae bacterium]